MTLSLADLEALDAADPLRRFRSRFELPAGTIYLDGNSLGALPRATADRLLDVVRIQWGRDLIRSWTDNGWIELPQRLGDKIGRIVGAAADQVIVADSTSVNIFKLLDAALQLRPGRKVILSDRGNFPTDLYVARGLAALKGQGHELRIVDEAALADAMGDDIAVVMLTQVNYRSGRLHDMAAITRAAHAAGAVTLWDLSHSAGALPVHLDRDEADFAVGCGYKYLNGGPGAPAFLYVAKRHQAMIRPALSGWFSHAAPFDFDLEYRPAEGIRRSLCGTPGILGLVALDAAIDLMLEADQDVLRQKSVCLCESFIALVEQECGDMFELASPRAAAQRGSQICLRHPVAGEFVERLMVGGVIPDFRPPDILRFGFAPLYIGFADLWHAVAALKRVGSDLAR